MAPEYRCPFCLRKFKNSEALAKHLLYDNCQKKNKGSGNKR